jgi:hypothetical protein
MFNDDKDRENFLERLSTLLPETKRSVTPSYFYPITCYVKFNIKMIGLRVINEFSVRASFNGCTFGIAGVLFRMNKLKRS